ncbi:MAG: sigma-70 family RNA polymerase sigma factor [Phycisphaerae bacterium]|nr:sigma-70 family RNA polymerase sigma factor [Phycisphaerae bacterium]
MAMDSHEIVRCLLRDRAKLLGYVWAIVRDHHAAEDIFQEVSALAIDRQDRINDAEHLHLWARKTARFKSLEWLRRQAHRPMSLGADVLEMLEAAWAHEDKHDSAQEMNDLQACMNELTPRARRLVHLRYTEGLSGIQVAEIVQTKVHSVYVAMTRIHRALEACIRRRREEAAAHG